MVGLVLGNGNFLEILASFRGSITRVKMSQHRLVAVFAGIFMVK